MQKKKYMFVINCMDDKEKFIDIFVIPFVEYFKLIYYMY